MFNIQFKRNLNIQCSSLKFLNLAVTRFIMKDIAIIILTFT